MTRQRNDSHSTEFGLWLRQQSRIDSKLGFVATNLDYIWSNYKTGEWCLIEEKRHMSTVNYSQSKLFEKLDWCARHHPKYKGLHILQFENTSPDDGKIFMDGREMNKEDLIRFLQFIEIGGE